MKIILTLFILIVSVRAHSTGEEPGSSGGTQTEICTDPSIAQAPPATTSDDPPPAAPARSGEVRDASD